MVKTISKNKTINAIIKILLIMYSIDFMGRQNILGICLCVLVGADLLACTKGKITINRKGQLIPLFIFGLLYSGTLTIIKPEEGIVNFIYYFVLPVGFYIIGSFILGNESVREQDVVKTMFVFTFGFFIIEVINVIYSMKTGMFMYSTEYIQDVWRGQAHARTISGMHLTPFVLLSIPCLLYGKNVLNKCQKLLLLIGALAGLGTSFFLGSRTLLMLFCVVLVIEILLAKKGKEWWGILGKLLLICIVLFFLYVFDVGNIQETIHTSYFWSRVKNGGAFDSGRWDVYKQWIQNLGTCFFGKIFIDESFIQLHYAHNIWIDTYFDTGFFPFCCLIWYTYRVIKGYVVVRKENTLTTHIYIAMCFGLLCNWALEPVLQANPYYFSCCCGLFAFLESRAYAGKENTIE